jgi:hypothetical protein
VRKGTLNADIDQHHLIEVVEWDDLGAEATHLEDSWNAVTVITIL